MIRTIQYAVHSDDGLVISRVGSEVAWPVLDFEKIGQDGDYTKPFEYQLEKMPVITIGREWRLLKWTKKIPVRLKNRHRKFWGFKPLASLKKG